MIKEIKKGLLSGFGAIFLTREKLENATRKLVQETKLSKEEAEKFVEELSQTGARQWEEIEANFSRIIGKGIERMDIASQKELNALKSQVAALENRINAMEGQTAPDAEPNE